MLIEHIERGGAWFFPGGCATWPFVTLRASPEHIRLEGNAFGIWRRKYEFGRQQIKSIEKQIGLISDGICIKHSIKDCPQVTIFWTFDYQALKKALEAMGYTIKENNPCKFGV